jgi:hypothetical protein
MDRLIVRELPDLAIVGPLEDSILLELAAERKLVALSRHRSPC